MEEPVIAVRKRDNSDQGNDEVANSTVDRTSNDDSTNGDANTQQVNQQQPPQESPWSVLKTIVFRVAIFWFIMNLFRGNKSPSTTGPSGTAIPPGANLFRNGDTFDLWVFNNEEPYLKDFDKKGDLVWKETSILYGEWYDGPFKDGSRQVNLKIDTSEKVQNNGSLYLHVFMVKQGFSPDPKSRYYERTAVVNQSKLLTVYRKQRLHKTKNLLTGESDAKPELIKVNNTQTPKIISYWHPNMTISVLYDQTPWTAGSIPQPIDQHIVFDNYSNAYYPVLYLNNYWNYASDYMPVNETTKTLELNLVFSPISLFKWQMYLSQQMRSQWNNLLGDTQEYSDEEQDMLKRTLQETNPYLLGLTIVVSLVHSVFEFLAFKNDIQFWRSRKSLEGLSVRSVFFNVFQSLIVVLFVLDNDTNTVVIISCFVGLLIELWKITKVVDIKVDRENTIGPFPRIRFEDKSTYTESATRKYDMLAFKYLSWMLFPLLGCYAVYSLIYQEHKGWYSWVLSMLYGFLLTFGFIMMTPQLFINYKLKSVAHLPWRMLTYKALNTFIDDIFAFVIKMPTLYRIGCLRDDVIFFIYVYQRWIYPIDYKRINEFGISGDGSTENDNQNSTTAGEQGKEGAAIANGEASPVNGQVPDMVETKKDK